MYGIRKRQMKPTREIRLEKMCVDYVRKTIKWNKVHLKCKYPMLMFVFKVCRAVIPEVTMVNVNDF